MRAAIYEEFAKPLKIQTVADPTPTEDGVVIEVRATGLCRSDWHGWMGHDPDIRLPHVPGHELAGEIAAVGKAVTRWKIGDRVTLPFVCGCGTCPQCVSGNHQVCDNQFQPGFTAWGSFAEYVEYKLNVRLAYYPPYHSKYNPVERCWGILEGHWNGSLLDSIECVVKFASTMTWKGKHPVVKLITKTYRSGVKLTKAAMEVLETHIERKPGLEKWFVDISFANSWNI